MKGINTKVFSSVRLNFFSPGNKLFSSLIDLRVYLLMRKIAFGIEDCFSLSVFLMNISSINERLNSTIQYEKILGDCRSCSKRFFLHFSSFFCSCMCYFTRKFNPRSNVYSSRHSIRYGVLFSLSLGQVNYLRSSSKDRTRSFRRSL